MCNYNSNKAYCQKRPTLGSKYVESSTFSYAIDLRCSSSGQLMTLFVSSMDLPYHAFLYIAIAFLNAPAMIWILHFTVRRLAASLSAKHGPTPFRRKQTSSADWPLKKTMRYWIVKMLVHHWTLFKCSLVEWSPYTLYTNEPFFLIMWKCYILLHWPVPQL